MAESGVPFVRRNLMYWAVRLFGGKPFKQNVDWRFVDIEYGDPISAPKDKLVDIDWRPWKIFRKARRIKDPNIREEFFKEKMTV